MRDRVLSGKREGQKKKEVILKNEITDKAESSKNESKIIKEKIAQMKENEVKVKQNWVMKSKASRVRSSFEKMVHNEPSTDRIVDIDEERIKWILEQKSILEKELKDLEEQEKIFISNLNISICHKNQILNEVVDLKNKKIKKSELIGMKEDAGKENKDNNNRYDNKKRESQTKPLSISKFSINDSIEKTDHNKISIVDSPTLYKNKMKKNNRINQSLSNHHWVSESTTNLRPSTNDLSNKSSFGVSNSIHIENHSIIDRSVDDRNKERKSMNQLKNITAKDRMTKYTSNHIEDNRCSLISETPQKPPLKSSGNTLTRNSTHQIISDKQSQKTQNNDIKVKSQITPTRFEVKETPRKNGHKNQSKPEPFGLKHSNTIKIGEEQKIHNIYNSIHIGSHDNNDISERIQDDHYIKQFESSKLLAVHIEPDHTASLYQNIHREDTTNNRNKCPIGFSGCKTFDFEFDIED